jgi:hypothetical protein
VFQLKKRKISCSCQFIIIISLNKCWINALVSHTTTEFALKYKHDDVIQNSYTMDRILKRITFCIPTTGYWLSSAEMCRFFSQQR